MGICDFLYNQTLTSINTSTPNVYGDRVLTANYSNVKCRFQYKTGMITNKDGHELQYKAEVYLSPDYSIAEGDEIIFNGETYVVIGKQPRVDFGGVDDHNHLYLR